MADYDFLFEKAKEQDFVERCTVAVMVLVKAIADDGAATTEEKNWAASATRSPLSAGKQAAYIVIATNKDATESVIDNATDAKLQTAVDGAKGVLVSTVNL